jgi:predicted DNA-binding transcriptional regulator AlpA
MDSGNPLQTQFTDQFYAWEICGRGWQLWNEPVELEPPFRPFFGHFLRHDHGATVDDGRKPHFLRSLADRFRDLVKGSDFPTELPESIEEAEPDRFEETGGLIEIHISLPSQTTVSKDAAEQFLMSVGAVSRPVSFEIVGTHDEIVVQIACGQSDARQVREQLQAFFPEAARTKHTDLIRNLWSARGDSAVVEFGLSKEFMRPLMCFRRFEPDPLSSIIGSMTELGAGEVALFQVLFLPARHPWQESILRAVTDGNGNSFFVDDRDMVSLAGNKIARPLFASVVRVAAHSATSEAAWSLAHSLAQSLRQFADPSSNELIPLSNEGYDDQVHVEDLLCRRSRRSGVLLNSDELVSLVHLPSASVRAAKLKREDRKSKPAPAVTTGHRLILGENQYGGKTVSVTASAEHRLRHTYVIGASGTGKSTFLLNLIVQDIQNGDGIAVLDPHGDLIEEIVARIPQERIGDVVLFDPSDEEYPVGFNILSAHSDLERNLLASDLVSVFRRLSTSWGDQMSAVLGNAVLAFLESTEGGTLSDLRRFLVELEFRERFLATVRDPEVVYYWRKEFPLLIGKPQGPILTRLDTFLRPKIVRHIVSQKENRLDFAAMMNDRRIFLAKLSQGLIGEENSYLLGSLLVSKFNQIAMSRQELRASDRAPFYLYIDEFHNFVSPSLAAILSGARKYRLGLILAHQELHQLASRDSDVASAVISNPFTRVCFRLGDSDAKKLADGFSFFEARDLQNLGLGEAICRMERSEYDFNLKTMPLPVVTEESAEERRAQVVTQSRERYAVPKAAAASAIFQEPAPTVAEYPSPPKRHTTKTVTVFQASESPQSTPTLTASVVSPLPGRGGQQHKYLQELIKRWAENRGYTVTVEKPILGGLGLVDVALEKSGRAIACEISVTTDTEHEVGNVQKCLAGGFEQVIVVSSDKKALSKIHGAAAEALPKEQLKKIRFMAPEELFSYIESLDATIAQATSGKSNDLLTAKELEELLRIDVKTIYSYAQRGLIPYVKIQSNLRFVRSDIMTWMAEKGYKPRTMPTGKR